MPIRHLRLAHGLAEMAFPPLFGWDIPGRAFWHATGFDEALMKARRRSRLEKVFTVNEKRELWKLKVSDIHLDRVDFRAANLAGASFERVSLADSDFTGADLRETIFLDCDLRRAAFQGATFGMNKFGGSWFTGATGLSRDDRSHIEASGGHFLQKIPAKLASSRRPAARKSRPR